MSNHSMSNNETKSTTLNSDAIEKALDDKQEPESLAEATTKALDEDALGGHATEEKAKK